MGTNFSGRTGEQYDGRNLQEGSAYTRMREDEVDPTLLNFKSRNWIHVLEAHQNRCHVLGLEGAFRTDKNRCSVTVISDCFVWGL
jgi:hypothetical protein